MLLDNCRIVRVNHSLKITIKVILSFRLLSLQASVESGPLALRGAWRVIVNGLSRAVQCSAVQYSAVQCSTVQYSTVQYSTVQYSTVVIESPSLPLSFIILRSLQETLIADQIIN